jgi:carboxypeptidase family protein
MKCIPAPLLSFTRKVIVASSCMAVVPLAVEATSMLAQDRAPAQRIVQGKVTDNANAPIKGAVVYLKDSRSLTVKSFFSDASGDYRFGQLSQTTDYEIWAENNGKKSAVKSISSFDSKSQFNINLKLEK